MKWWEWLYFLLENGAYCPGETIEVINDGNNIGRCLILEKNPDFDRMLGHPNPPCPVKPTRDVRSWWQEKDLDSRRYYLMMAYLYHPDPQVVLRAMHHPVLASHDLISLAYLAAHPNEEVSHAVAVEFWCQYQEKYALEVVLTVLSSTGIWPSGIHPIDAARATRILQEHCPPERLAAFEKLAQRKKLLPRPPRAARALKKQESIRVDRLEKYLDGLEDSSVFWQEAEPAEKGDDEDLREDGSNPPVFLPQSSQPVVFVQERREVGLLNSIKTYRIFRAESAQAAMAFLSSSPVEDRLLEIVVETPEGNYYSDIQGVRHD